MRPRVAIVDYGMGNLFSVRQACQHAGMEGVITASAQEVLEADAVILPGVGAFGDAMEALRRLDLVSPLREAATTKPFMGVCLGLQLMMEESYEFGRHRGLGLFPGAVRRLEPKADESGRRPKVPQVGWNRVFPTGDPPENSTWEGTLLEGIPAGEYMYFVHSYYPEPADPQVILCVTEYGGQTFCSGLGQGQLSAFQFHPERSGPLGLRIYRNLAQLVTSRMEATGSR